MRQKLLLLAAVFFGILAVIFTYQLINMEREKITGSMEDRQVVKMVKQLSEGETITDDCIAPEIVKRAANEKNNEIPWKSRNNIKGRKVNTQVNEGTILTWFSIDQSADQSGKTGLTSKLRSNSNLLVGLAVDNISSLNGLIRPNNYVDIIGTFRLPGMNNQEIDTITLTIMKNVRVVACGTDTGDEDIAAPRRASSYNMITLEVPEDQVELLIFAQQKGRITLALRNAYNRDDRTPRPRIDWDKFLEKLGHEAGQNQSPQR